MYYLISLLKPGHLGNYDTFQSAFSASKHDLEHDDYLKELVNQVMVRNRREDTGIDWTNRRVQIVPITFTDEEREVYEMLGNLQNTGSFSLITLQKKCVVARKLQH